LAAFHRQNLPNQTSCTSHILKSGTVTHVVTKKSDNAAADGTNNDDIDYIVNILFFHIALNV